jgi:hypothetical protein
MKSKRGASVPTAEQTAAAAALAREGWPPHLIAHKIGLPEAVLLRWFARGEAGRRAYVAFFEAIREADAGHTQALLATIGEAAERGSQRAARFLKRFHRDKPAVPVPETTGRGTPRPGPKNPPFPAESGST